MQHNYKLKLAVTAALSLMTFGAQNTAFALGLGDIKVNSALGQPLKASIRVLGANDIKDTACLKLGSGRGNLTKVNFALGPINNGVATLSLTTVKAVNEPILNISVIADCTSAVQRHYVLLLDPPFLLPNIESAPALIAAVVQKSDTHAEKSAISNQKRSEKLTKKAVKKQSRSKNKVFFSSKNTYVTSRNIQKKPKKTLTDNKSYLSISGGSPYVNATGLQLDKRLTFGLSTNAPLINVEVQNIEIQDEVAVMNNRLAHLQQQISSLQQQNLKLVSDNRLKTNQLVQADSPINLTNLLPFLGAGLVLVGGYFAVRRLRRRTHKVQAEEAKPFWADTKEFIRDSEAGESSLHTEEDIFADLDFEQTTNGAIGDLSSMQHNFEVTQAADESVMLEDDHQEFSILDHADVFLSHGRASLAIQLLQNHLLDHPKQSITIWLFLLDLLAKENLKSLYEQTAADCKEHFNMQISDFLAAETSSNQSLEDFPHLAEGLQTVWNTPASVTFLDDLIFNGRLEPRAGLAKNLVEELILLKGVAEENASSAKVIQLDEKKLALMAQKEDLLATKKTERLRQMVEKENVKKAAREEAEVKATSAKNETDFEFNLVEFK